MVYVPNASGPQRKTQKSHKAVRWFAFLRRPIMDQDLSHDARVLVRRTSPLSLDESAQPRAQSNFVPDRTRMLMRKGDAFRVHVRSGFKRIFHCLLDWLGIRRLREHSFFCHTPGATSDGRRLWRASWGILCRFQIRIFVSRAVLVEANPTLAESLKGNIWQGERCPSRCRGRSKQ